MLASALSPCFAIRDGLIPYFCQYADMPVSTSANMPILLDKAASQLTADIYVSAYQQHFLIADTNTERCADMLIFPIPILVSAHPYVVNKYMRDTFYWVYSTNLSTQCKQTLIKIYEIHMASALFRDLTAQPIGRFLLF